jgi:Zn finger protein HypA/HybF involved in hydrogenase expression
MKWTKELDNNLIKLFNEGKNYIEIGEILNTTSKSASCRGQRLGLNYIKSHRIEIKCKNCNNVFSKKKSETKVFCSRSC